ncbi:MAG: OB-fold-containig protein [Pseudomonadota bacterium]
MTILELLLHPGLLPFEIAVGIVIGLLLLEVAINQIGFSLLGGTDTDGDFDTDLSAEPDLGGEFGLSPELEAEIDPIDGFDADQGLDLDMETEAPGVVAGGGLLSWLGLGKVPFTIWVTGMLTAFGLSGYFIQLFMNSVFGAPLSALVASAISLPPAVFLGSHVARGIGRLFPKTKTTAISTRSYSRRKGVITVGTARRDAPAQARFRDGHGNWHYAMVVPLDAKEELPQGTEVMILRTRDGVLKAVRIA